MRRRNLLFQAGFAAVAFPAVNSVALADENGEYNLSSGYAFVCLSRFGGLPF